MIWDISYWLKRTPWDTGVTPPELVSLVDRHFSQAGRAIDIGCGTGTNVVYLARRGFSVFGIDISRRAVAMARRRVQDAGVSAEVRVGSATRLSELAGGSQFDLAVDIGCFHSLSRGAQRSYADQLSLHVVKGGLYLLYAFRPRPSRLRQRGVTPDDVGSLFADGFLVQDVALGTDTGSGRDSAWYTLERV